jgi:hypothetical protein
MRYKLAPILVLALVISVGCATTLSPLARVEQSQQIAFDVIDAYLLLEYQTPQLDQNIPGAHALAEQMRAKVPDLMEGLTAAMDSYRLNRTAGGEVVLQTYLASLAELANQAQIIMAKWGAK